MISLSIFSKIVFQEKVIFFCTIFSRNSLQVTALPTPEPPVNPQVADLQVLHGTTLGNLGNRSNFLSKSNFTQLPKRRRQEFKHLP